MVHEFIFDGDGFVPDQPFLQTTTVWYALAKQ